MSDEILSTTFYGHAYMAASLANGPGIRSVIWFQGCTLGCPGCFNPQTHQAKNRRPVNLPVLFQEINLAIERHGIEGITISGGEPFQQPEALREIIRWVRTHDRHLSVIVFTGYNADELERMPIWHEIKGSIDVTIAGRYEQGLRVAAGLEGSANKMFIFSPTSIYCKDDFFHIPPVEIHFTKNGAVISGIRPDFVDNYL